MSYSADSPDAATSIAKSAAPTGTGHSPRGPVGRISQHERIWAFVERHGQITNADMILMGLVHVGRNRLTDARARAHFASMDKFIVFVNAPRFEDHRWEMRDLPTKGDNVEEITKQDLLNELPKRRLRGEAETYDDFRDLEEMILKCKFTQGEMGFLRREIVARREKSGLKPGLQTEPKRGRRA
ncbi:MAG: hypothetical protein E6Q97_38860 [Desulfurellales bacterium]|nr:MAG: hypothetical protein E6Q97_38860 [Desulfurellales bacterium]